MRSVPNPDLVQDKGGYLLYRIIYIYILESGLFLVLALENYLVFRQELLVSLLKFTFNHL